MNHRKHKAPFRRRIGRRLQDGAGVSHADITVQRRKFFLPHRIPISNATATIAYGLDALNVGTNAGVNPSIWSNIMTNLATQYEQYKIRRVRVRAQVGQGFTNDRRLQTYLLCRVDKDNQLNTPTLSNLLALQNSENTVMKTLTERGNVLLADFQPKCFVSGTVYTVAQLPNVLEWYTISDNLDRQLWRGAVAAPVVTDPTITPNSTYMNITLEVDVDLRGRAPAATIFNPILSTLPDEPRE